mmetsp:Transcript_13229/g.11709  ORF Transcript_13229/g.11709 Transcript_13229/m.11709 type:complete len:120 (+) Transcript_13229:464-823(+)
MNEVEKEELCANYDRFMTQAPLKMKEYHTLYNIFWRVKLWRMQARIVLAKGVNFSEIQKLQKECEDHKENRSILYKKDKRLLKMLHECEIFPFPVQEKEKMINLLKEIRYVRQVFETNA